MANHQRLCLTYVAAWRIGMIKVSNERTFTYQNKTGLKGIPHSLHNDTGNGEVHLWECVQENALHLLKNRSAKHTLIIRQPRGIEPATNGKPCSNRCTAQPTVKALFVVSLE